MSLIDTKKPKGLFDIGEMKEKEPSNLLSDRFLVPPFSVFDTKQGYWLNRKRAWVDIGIKSEVGRGDNLTYNLGSFDYNEEKAYQQEKSKFGKSLPEGFDAEKYGIKPRQATSIFDPVLCEIVYRWFATPNADILDPFAGGSVRGIVAGTLGHNYTGIDLSETQVEANRQQWADLNEKYTAIRGNAQWIIGNSENSIELTGGDKKYDLVFSCPPYYDLEVYSDNPEDLSAMGTYEEFLIGYEKVIANAISMLKDNSFAVFVVGDVRDKKTGEYYNFVGDTVNAFKKAGALYYNEGILLNSIGTLPLRVPKQFNAGRKLGKQHQNVLVFYKGDTKAIKEKFGDAEIAQ